MIFRAEIDVGKKYEQLEFYLEFDLYFCDLKDLGSVKNWKNNVEAI